MDPMLVATWMATMYGVLGVGLFVAAIHIAAYFRRGLARLQQCTATPPVPAQEPAPYADRWPPETLPCDWTAVANELRRVMGMDPYQGPERYPTVEELANWERTVPGSVDWLRALVQAHARLRHQRTCA